MKHRGTRLKTRGGPAITEIAVHTPCFFLAAFAFAPRFTTTITAIMRRLVVPLKWILVVCRVLLAAAQDTFIDVTLTRCVSFSRSRTKKI